MNTITSSNTCECNTLSSDCATTSTVSTNAAGSVTGAVQFRSSTGTFDANNSFYYDFTKMSLVGGTIYPSLYEVALPNQQYATNTNIPFWARRITIQFETLGTSTGSTGIVIPSVNMGDTNGFSPANIIGSTWGNSDFDAERSWNGVGVYLYNTTWAGGVGPLLTGNVVIQRIGEVEGKGYYTITMQSQLKNGTVERVSTGAGRFLCPSLYITQVRIAAPGNTSFTFGGWSILCE